MWLVSYCVGQQGGNGSAPGQQTEQPQQEDEDDEEEEGTEGQILPFYIYSTFHTFNCATLIYIETICCSSVHCFRTRVIDFYWSLEITHINNV